SPAASALEVVHVSVPSVQLHAAPPEAAGAEGRGGGESTTVTVPDVVQLHELVAVIVYVAPVSPWVKLPVCDFAAVMSASWLTAVGSEAVSFDVFDSPPPEIVAVFVTDDAAVALTFTVTVMAG